MKAHKDDPESDPVAPRNVVVVADHGRSGVVVAYDVETAEEVYRFGVPEKPLRVAKVSQTEYAVSSDATHISIHKRSSGEKLRSINYPRFKGYVYGLETVWPLPGERFRRLIVGDCSSNLVVFNSKTGRVISKLPEPPMQTHDIRCVSEWDHEAYVLGLASSEVPRYDLVRATLLSRLRGHRSPVRAIDVDFSTSTLLTASMDRTAKLWSHDHLQCVATLFLSAWARCACFAPELYQFFVGNSNGFVEAWDPRNTKQRLAFLQLGTSSVEHTKQVGTNMFVSALNDTVWWCPDGTIVNKASTSGGFCAMGTPYDRPSPLIDVFAEEESERVGYLVERMQFVAGRVRVDAVGCVFGIPRSLTSCHLVKRSGGSSKSPWYA